MKKHNPYCVEDVMKKHNISFDEATDKVQDLKKRTTITLENLVRKYGEEEGKKRFETFCKKSAHTKEKYMEKYGDKWEEFWREYLASKSCSLQKFVERYGDEEGKKLYLEYQAKKSYSNSLESYINKYGKEEGVAKHQDIQKKRNSGSLSHFIEKYGAEEGPKKYDEVNIKKNTSSLSFFINKYGEKEGVKRYEERKMRCSPIFVAIKKEYGEEKAIEAYKNYEIKQFDLISEDLELISAYKTNIKNKRLSKGPVSKESNNFFNLLELSLNRKLNYGKKSSELKLANLETSRYFCYDCYDEISKTIIEFHGITWHPKDGQTDWTNPFGASYEKIRNKDLKKKELAESKGYNYIVVYSDEVKTVDQRDEKIHLIKEMINGNCKED